MTNKVAYVFTVFALIAFVPMLIASIRAKEHGSVFIGACGIVACSVYLHGEYEDTWK